MPQVVQAEGFTLRGNAAEVVVQNLATHICEVMRSLRAGFPFAEQTQLPLQVLVFPHQAAYRRFAAERAPENLSAQGYLDPANGWLVTYSDRDPTTFDRTLRHELTHYLLRCAVGHAYLPPWLDEGLACYLEWRTDRDPPNAQADAPGFSHQVVQLLRDSRLPSWETFCTQGYDGFMVGADAALLDRYAFAWSLVAFLLEDSSQTRTWLEDYVRQVAAATDPTTAYREAFATTLGDHLPWLRSAYTLWLSP